MVVPLVIADSSRRESEMEGAFNAGVPVTARTLAFTASPSQRGEAEI